MNLELPNWLLPLNIFQRPAMIANKSSNQEEFMHATYQFEDLNIAISERPNGTLWGEPGGGCTPTSCDITNTLFSSILGGVAGQDHAAWLMQRAADNLK